MPLPHPNCPLCGQPGQAVAGIHAAQTRSGETRGTIVGMGVGVASSGIGAGVASGRIDTWTIERSRLADLLAPPPAPTAKQPPQFGWLLLALGVVAVFVGWWSTPLGDLRALVDGPRDLAGWAGVAAIAAGLMSLGRKVTAPTPAQVADWKVRAARWNRLRYCATDHHVYDPENGEHWAP